MTTATAARRVRKITTQEIVGALRAAGFVAAIRTTRVRRSGFGVTRITPYGIAVQHHDWANEGDDHAAEADRMTLALEAAGFVVSRPFPDVTLLGVSATA
jgi:hypothetical protein